MYSKCIEGETREIVEKLLLYVFLLMGIQWMKSF